MLRSTLVTAAVLLVALAGCQCQPRRAMLGGGDIGTQIVGGYQADIKEFPYQIAMLSYGSLICGGSIISSTWVLTASHCVVDSFADSTSVRAGSTFNTRGGQVVAARSTAYHPNFDMTTMQNDVALIELRSPLTLDGVTARAISLVPANTKIATGDMLVVSGWGTLYSGAWTTPNELYAVMVPVVPHSMCQLVYTGIESAVDDTMFCAGVEGKDSCQGDSGGPVVDSEGRQVGVVSWGKGCAEAGYPGVYASLANKASHDWIVKTANLQE